MDNKLKNKMKKLIPLLLLAFALQSCGDKKQTGKTIKEQKIKPLNYQK